MIRNSLTRKLIVVFSAILIAVVFLNIIINAFLLAKVYRNKKIDAMEHLFTALYNQYAVQTENSAIVETVKESLSHENFRVFIWDENDELVVDSLPLSIDDGDREAYNDKIEEPSLPFPHELKDFPLRDHKNTNRWKNFGRMELNIYYSDVSNENEIRKNEQYEIFSTKSFTSTPEDENLVLRGVLPGGFKVLIQMPVASLEEAVEVSNGLLLAIGILMLVIGIIVVSVTSRNIAKPVKELSEIALAMQNLDFSRKYTYQRTDEIGSLGKSISSLSEKLETTINELYKKNEELRKDNELKSRIDMMRKDFIANASHELKTPVALISGYAEGLRDNVASDESMRAMYTDVIIEETEKMNHIILQMLDLMEIDGTEGILDGGKISVSALAEEAIDELSVLIKNKDIVLEVNLDDECLAYGDRARIYQAITNYISNAINHVDDKKIIRVTVKNLETQVKVSVYNSGLNLSDEEFDNIWERFYKVDKSHSREYGGTGLGLSIVKSIIELHKGTYGALNHQDGIEFYFILNKEKANET